jgi:hypothetical protein
VLVVGWLMGRRSAVNLWGCWRQILLLLPSSSDAFAQQLLCSYYQRLPMQAAAVVPMRPRYRVDRLAMLVAMRDAADELNPCLLLSSVRISDVSAGSLSTSCSLLLPSTPSSP